MFCRKEQILFTESLLFYSTPGSFSFVFCACTNACISLLLCFCFLYFFVCVYFWCYGVLVWHIRMQQILRNWRHFMCLTFRRPQPCVMSSTWIQLLVYLYLYLCNCIYLCLYLTPKENVLIAWVVNKKNWGIRFIATEFARPWGGHMLPMFF